MLKEKSSKLLILQLLEPLCTPRDPILFQRPGYKVDAGIMGSNVTLISKLDVLLGYIQVPISSNFPHYMFAM